MNQLNEVRDKLLLLDQSNVCFIFEALLLKAENCQNNEILDAMASYLIFKIKNDHCLVKKLKVALLCGNPLLVSLLLSKGVRLDDPEWKGTSPAVYVFKSANISCRKEILTLLIKHNLKTNLRIESGRNILHIYIDEYVQSQDADAVEIAKILIDSGISVNETMTTYRIRH